MSRTLDEKLARADEVEQALRDGKPHEDIIFYFNTDQSDIVGNDDSVGEAYAIIKCEDAHSGLIVYAKFKGRWSANPHSSRPMIKRLLDSLANQRTEIKQRIEALPYSVHLNGKMFRISRDEALVAVEGESE